MKLIHFRIVPAFALVGYVAAVAVIPALAVAQAPAPQEAVSVPREVDELVPIEILEAVLRPMRLAEAEVELGNWMRRLQAKSLEVSNAEIEGFGLEESEGLEFENLTELSVELRAERDRLIERVAVVIVAVEQKGGDPTEAAAYITSVVASPPISTWRAAATMLRAWLWSEDGGVALARNIGIAAVIFFVTWLLALLLGRTLRRILSGTESASELLRSFAVKALRRSVMFFGLLLALSQLGFNMGPMLAAIGALGLVVGLALQGTLSNFASGLLMMIYRPFDIGDVIDAAGTLGEVEGMTLVTTSIKTLDNQRLSIPNNMIWGGVITNVTAEDTRRVDMVFGIGYSDDVGKAKEVLMDILEQHERVLESPEPTVKVSELGDSSVNFVVRPWVDTEDYWDVFWDVTQAVKERFDAEGISIPYPQRDLHVYHETATPDGVAGGATNE